MKLLCEKRYLLLPVRETEEPRRLCFRENGSLVYDLPKVHLSPDNPEFFYPLDLGRFRGRTLEVETIPPVEFALEMTDDLPQGAEAWDGADRPLAHYTAPRGWLNDPNGLIFLDGRYLMFLQHNPAGSAWANMHWRLAESTDLIHWKDRGIALFPDENGAPYSGSAILDRENRSGLGEEGNPALLLYYTSAGDRTLMSEGKPFEQYLAYSTDGGRTIRRYAGNPILPFHVGENRDPLVLYHRQTRHYVMALFLDGDEFAIYHSDNLLDWTPGQTIHLEGEAECPAFYPLCVDGDANQEKWVLMGASDRYVIGDFDGQTFVPMDPVPQPFHYGNSSYASQSWTDAPDGRRIRVSFLHTNVEHAPFGSCMGIPADMSLKTRNGRIRLCGAPVPELSLLHRDPVAIPAFALEKGEAFHRTLEGRSWDLAMTVRPEEGACLVWWAFGLELEYREDTGTLRLQEFEAPVDLLEGELDLRVIVDTVSVEVYAAGGSVYLTARHVQDPAQSDLTLTAEAGRAEIPELRLVRLAPFWEEA